MVKTLTKLAKFPRLIDQGKKDKIIFVKLNTHTLNVAELRVKSNAIHTENISKKIAGQYQPNAPRLSREKGTAPHDIRMNNATGKLSAHG